MKPLSIDIHIVDSYRWIVLLLMRMKIVLKGTEVKNWVHLLANNIALLTLVLSTASEITLLRALVNEQRNPLAVGFFIY
ncbi:unnamed protein product [Rhizophagus irregularis]|nr:unnamed protein product [Rhizophagus irregularis]